MDDPSYRSGFTTAPACTEPAIRELAPDGRPRAVVALALDAEAARVRPGAPAARPHHDEVPGPVARHRRGSVERRGGRVRMARAPPGRQKTDVALALDAAAARVRPGAPGARPHHDEVPGPVARHRRVVLVARRVRVHLELAPDGRPRAVVALALDAGADRVRPGAPVALPHHDEVPGPVARHRR